MGADTWVNLVPRSNLNATCPKSPKTVPATPVEHENQQANRANSGMGWFWLKRRPSSPVALTQPIEAAAGTPRVTSPEPITAAPRPISRSSSGCSWLEVVPNGSEDLTDIEDTTTVAIGPRPEPQVRAVRVSATSPREANLKISDDSPEIDLDAPSVAPQATIMEHIRPEATVRSRGPLSAAHREKHDKWRETESSSLNDSSQSDSSCGFREAAGEGSLSVARVAAACGVSPDPDLVWTFLAGMMLYFMSV